MTTVEILRNLHQAGVRVSVERDDLLLHNSAGLSPELIAAVTANKLSLIRAIRAAAPVDRFWDVVPDPVAHHEPFPLNDLQRAYILGRNSSVPLGGIGCHAYFEFDVPELDPARFEPAWRDLVATEDVLRLIIVDGREQVILPAQNTCPLTITDLRSMPDAIIDAARQEWREQMTARVHDPGVWPLWDLRVMLLPGKAARLHAEFDLIATDAAALYGVLSRLTRHYAGSPASETPPWSFRDVHMAAARSTDEYETAVRWWAQQLPRLPDAPDLPLRTPLTSLASPRFRRHRTELPESAVNRLEALAAARNLTLAAVLNQAFIETIGRHCRNRQFLVNMPIFLPPVRIPIDRLPLGNYTSNILVGVDTTGGDFTRRAARTAGEIMTALSYRAYSGVKVMGDLARQRGAGLDPMAPVVLTNLLAHRHHSMEAALPGQLTYGVSRTPQVLLDHQIVPTPEGLLFHWDVVEGAFEDDFVQALSLAHIDLLDRLGDGLAWDEPGWEENNPAPPPVLPTALAAGTGQRHTVDATLSVEGSELLRAACARHDVDLPTVALAACAEVIGRWSEISRFPLAVAGERGDWHLRPVDCMRSVSFIQRVHECRAIPLVRGFVAAEAAVVLRRLGDIGGADDYGGSGIPMSVSFSFLVADAVDQDIETTDSGWADVSCRVVDRGPCISTTWQDSTGRCADGVLASMTEALIQAMLRLADDASWAQPLDVLPADVVDRRAEVNASTRLIEPALLHNGFVAAARHRPDAPALIAPGKRLTYRDLDARTDRLAMVLRTRNVRPDELVAVVLDDNCQQVEAALGVLKAGAAYVPIDTCWPERRKQEILHRSNARLAVTTRQIAGSSWWPAEVAPIDIDVAVEAEAAIVGNDASLPALSTAPSDLAYVIFTSGSTGEPKGVAVEHAAAHNTVVDMIERFGVAADDRVFGLSAFTFDLSVFDIFGTLAAGAALVLPSRSAQPDPQHWQECMIDGGVTVWNSVPALMELLVAHLERANDPRRAPLRHCWLSGDYIPLTLPDRVRRIFRGVGVTSLGGATEAAIWSIYHRIGEVDPRWRTIPYGRPLGNQRWHVLDDAGQPRPDGVAGDLYIAGSGLARGYWEDPERTAASFAVHRQLQDRLYRTGDRGRYHPDGTIEFLGRRDTQVKVRGHRIELGEIEAVLGQHPAVRQAVAAVRATSTGGDRLAAWVTLHPDLPALPAELEGYLRQRLPSYMVPALLVVDEIALTANGKVDRSALPEPFAGPATAECAQGAPPLATPESDAMARDLCTLIGETLGCDPPGPTDNLIRLGASSLDVVTLVAEIEQRYGFRPSYQDFFSDPTVAALVRAATGQEQPGSALPVARASIPAPRLLAPAERDAFKQAGHGIRAGLAGRDPIRLSRSASDAELMTSLRQRRSVRHFLPRSIPLETFGGWLATLSVESSAGTRRHTFGSAGGSYSVQTYVHVKPDGVRDCPAGIYYYQPVEHALVPISIGTTIDPKVHDPFINRPVFDEAWFSIFFVSCPKAIEPMYGELSERFGLLEAGAMSHTLELTAANFGLGVCAIGVLDFAGVVSLLQLAPDQQIFHSLVGGLLPGPDLPEVVPDVAWQEGEL